jgi:hypothetical protein
MSKNDSNQKIKITFNPLHSAAMQKTVLLKERKLERVNGVEQYVIRELIDGLPQVFTIKRDEIVEVTPEQFKQLYAFGFVETEKDRSARLEVGQELPKQSGIDPKTRNASQLNDIYKDKFIKVE